MTTFVLVPGAWLGGWCWKQVIPLLRGEGHEVYTLTLTGLGERAHLARPEVDLETHITDVVNVFEYEDLCNVCSLGTATPGSWSPAWLSESPIASPSWCTWTQGRFSTAWPSSTHTLPKPEHMSSGR